MTIRTLWMDSDGAGAVEYDGRAFRDLVETLLLVGTLEGLGVVERQAGANMTVTIGAGRCVAPSSWAPDQGRYLVTVSDDVEDLAIGAAPGSGTRRDIVGLQVLDDGAGGPSGQRETVPLVVEGDTSGSDPALPDSFIALARVRVPNGTVSITDALIDDLRTPVRLAYELVDTDVLADLAVTGAKLAAAAVTTGKLNDLAVTTGKLNDLAVTTGKLANGAVTDAKSGSPATGELQSGNIRYARYGGIVHVWTGTSGGGAGSPTLPAGFRPAQHVTAPAIDPEDNSGSNVGIGTGGSIITPGGANRYFAVSFAAA